MGRDALMKRLESLRLSVRQMTEMMRHFEAVVDKENAAIARSDINELEAITQEKSFFGTKLEEAVQALQKQLHDLYPLLGLNRAASEVRIEEFLQDLSCFRESQGTVDWDASIDGLAFEMNQLRETRWRLFPKIEANSYMVRKLLQYHRETYAFWQAVAQESETVYGKTGKTRAAVQKSILTVRT